MKRVRMALALIMALICALALWACASGETEGGGSTPGGTTPGGTTPGGTTPGGTTTEFTLTEFNVAANMKVNLGDEVTVPAVTAKGSDNQTYTATSIVTDSDGKTVTVTSGKFTADDVDGYTITYTVHANDKDFKKTTEVEVFSLTEFEVEESVLVNLGDEVTVPTVTAKGSDNQTYTATSVVTDSDGKTVTVTSGKFTADDVDGYTITYTVHANDKDFTKSTTVEVFTLTEFEVAETAEVNYGEEYTVPAVTAKGSDGKDYPAIYEVTDSKDAPVVINGGKFTATDLEGYTITYTVTANGKDYTKTTALTVVDAAAPVIAITDIDGIFTPTNSYETYTIDRVKYTVGDTFEQPDYTITDNLDGDGLEATEVYLKYVGSDATDEDAKITIPQEGYTFTKLGDYEFHVVAKDEAENEADECVEFSVRAQAFDGEIEGFNDPYAPVYIHSGGNISSMNRSFVQDEVGGVKPSNGGYFLKIEATGANASAQSYADIWTAPRFTKEQLDGWIADGTYNAIEIRFFVDASSAGHMDNLTSKFRGENQKHKTVFNYGVWNSFVIFNGRDAAGTADAAGRILPWYSENFDTIKASQDGSGTFLYFAFRNSATIYIDTIRLVKTTDIWVNGLAPENENLEATTFDDLGLIVRAGGKSIEKTADLNYEVFASYDGGEYTKLVDTYDFSETEGTYSVVVNVDNDEYAGCREITFKNRTIGTEQKEAREYEYFDNDGWSAKVSGGGTVEVVPTSEVFEKYPDPSPVGAGDARYGGNCLKITTTSDNGGFVNVFCAPHATKSEFLELAGLGGKASTYEYLNMRWLVHYGTDDEPSTAADCVRSLYTPFINGDMWQRDYSNYSSTGFGPADQWQTIAFTNGDNLNTDVRDQTSHWLVPNIARFYDDIASLNAPLFYFTTGKYTTGADGLPNKTAGPTSVGNCPVVVYIQYINMASDGASYHRTIEGLNA